MDGRQEFEKKGLQLFDVCVVQVLDTSQSGEFCACICSLFNDAFQ
jgi:hypothetical protein